MTKAPEPCRVLQSLRGKSLERSYAPLVGQTRINISASCNRIFIVPCKLDTQEKNSVRSKIYLDPC